jgi:hypothetical protein
LDGVVGVDENLTRLIRAQVNSLRATSGAESGEHRGKQSFSFKRIHVFGYSFGKYESDHFLEVQPTNRIACTAILQIRRGISSP